jgi:hypothetical protein
MAYPPNFSAFVDEEASDAVKRFCREHCKLKRGEIAADIDLLVLLPSPHSQSTLVLQAERSSR